MSERLINGLKASQDKIGAGLTQTEKELAELRARCRELEEILALGKVTQFAAQLVGGFTPASVPDLKPASTTQSPPAPAPPAQARSVPKTNHEHASDAAGEKAPSLAERAAVLRAALDNK